MSEDSIGPAAQAPATGDAEVDAALAELDALDPGDLDAFLTRAENVRARLGERLSDLDGT